MGIALSFFGNLSTFRLICAHLLRLGHGSGIYAEIAADLWCACESHKPPYCLMDCRAAQRVPIVNTMPKQGVNQPFCQVSKPAH